jgi:phosphosulfolactate synthase (CoM biosynthesis protein A)
MTSTTEARTETERAFAFLRLNQRPPKPRKRGVTEIRGPYYAPVGRRYLEDLFEAMGAYVDTLKYAGGSFALMPRETVRALNELCHQHGVEVSTGGFLEYVLTQRGDAVARATSRNARRSASTSSRSRAASSPSRSTTLCG